MAESMPAQSERTQTATTEVPARPTAPPEGDFDLAEREDPNETGRLIEASLGSWLEKSILAFDGGGIRGYAMLLMLEELMVKIADEEYAYDKPHQSSFSHRSSFGPFDRPKTLYARGRGLLPGACNVEYLPCHYFDYIIGTSTGGLIATMLSRWRMSVAECIQQYEIFGRDIFGSPRTLSLFGYPRTKHSKKPLIAAIKKLTRERIPPNCTNPDFNFFEAPSDLCRTIVVAIRKGKMKKTTEGETVLKERVTDGEYLFRSYKPVNFNELAPPLNAGVKIRHEIWEVCRATTAAPFFFDPQEIHGDEYCDGGVGVNNPTEKALDELESLNDNTIKVVASFGTGMPESESAKEPNSSRLNPRAAVARVHQLLKTARAALTDCERTHSIVERRAQNLFKYFRFNVEEGLRKVKLDEWKAARDDGRGGKCTTIQYIRTCTEKVIQSNKFQTDLQMLAKQLVAQRRNRIKDIDRWERFACCVLYTCPEDECRIEGKTRSYALRRDMEEHLRNDHGVPREQMGEELGNRRKLPDHPAGPF